MPARHALVAFQTFRFDQVIRAIGMPRCTRRKNVDMTCKKRVEKQKPRKSENLRGFAAIAGGDGGIRTLDPGFGPDAPLAGECLRPLGHVSQTFARAGSQRDEAKIIAGSRNVVNF